jgi:hypothetical protein
MTAADTIAFTSRTRSRRLPDGGSVDRDATSGVWYGTQEIADVGKLGRVRAAKGNRCTVRGIAPWANSVRRVLREGRIDLLYAEILQRRLGRVSGILAMATVEIRRIVRRCTDHSPMHPPVNFMP